MEVITQYPHTKGTHFCCRRFFTDGHNNGFQIVNLAQEFSSLTTTVSVEVISRNDDPTGIVIISGSVAEDEILTAINDLADVDGLGDLAPVVS